MAIQIVVNGKSASAPDAQTILGLLHDLGLDPERVAVELDRRIIKRPDWGGMVLDPGARLEIVQFVGGG